MSAQIDRFVLDQWYPICAELDVVAGQPFETTLLEQKVTLRKDATGAYKASRSGGDASEAGSQPLPVIGAYGFVWTSLGSPPEALFPIPEYSEPDRRNVWAATVGVNVSAPRAIENFLDMGHFPFVHTDILGVEPHTEVKEYDVDVSLEKGEILATRCKFYQPRASTTSTEGADVDYIYRVPHPFCSVLYKSSAPDGSRFDVVAVFLQPVDQEHIRAHMMLSILDSVSSDAFIRQFQQTIFGQDKPILENQLPKRLPLDPRAETPIRADKSAVVYRRWLSQNGVTYGVIPAAA